MKKEESPESREEAAEQVLDNQSKICYLDLFYQGETKATSYQGEREGEERILSKAKRRS